MSTSGMAVAAATDASVSSAIANAGSATRSALDARYGKIDATGALLGKYLVINGVTSPGGTRVPVVFSNTIDGSKLTAANPSDKVAVGNTVLFKGGFSNEAANGASNPDWLWGANDFIITGTTAGDLAGITTMEARLTELHIDTPGAALNNAYSFVADTGLGATALGATISGWLASAYFKGPTNNTGQANRAANTATVIINSPDAAVAPDPNTWALRVEGTARAYLGGDIEMNASSGEPKYINAYYGGFKGVTVTVGNPGTASQGRVTVVGQSDADKLLVLQGRGGQSDNLLSLQIDSYIQSRFDNRGRLVLNSNTSPAIPDANLNNGELSFYVDSTSGAMKLMIKAKDAGGTIRTGQVALT